MTIWNINVNQENFVVNGGNSINIIFYIASSIGRVHCILPIVKYFVIWIQHRFNNIYRKNSLSRNLEQYWTNSTSDIVQNFKSHYNKYPDCHKAGYVSVSANQQLYLTYRMENNILNISLALIEGCDNGGKCMKYR